MVVKQSIGWDKDRGREYVSVLGIDIEVLSRFKLYQWPLTFLLSRIPHHSLRVLSFN